MNLDNARLKQEQRVVEEEASHQESARNSGRQFATVEEMLKYDREQNPVPPEVVERLSASLAAEPKSAKTWYQKLFG